MRPSRLLLTAALLVLLCEATLHGVDLPLVDRARRALDPGAFAREHAPVEPHPYLAYANRRGWRGPAGPDGAPARVHDALGFRLPPAGAPPAAEGLRIACLGGSGTYGSDDVAWPDALAAALAHEGRTAAEVLNAGTLGYTSAELLIDLALRVADVAPDVLVVRPDVDDALALRLPAARDNSHWRTLWSRSAPTTAEALLGWSWTWRGLRTLLTDGPGGRGALESAPVRPEARSAASAGAGAGSAPDPAGLRLFARNLEHLAVLAREGGAALVLVPRAPGPGAVAADEGRALDAVLRELADATGALLADPGAAAAPGHGALPDRAEAERIARAVVRALRDAGLVGG